MDDFSNMLTKILDFPSETMIDDFIFELFQFQFQHVAVYQEYCNSIQRTTPSSILEIPFLPIEFFKTRDVIVNNTKAEKIFMSSGTSKTGRSRHLVKDLSLYELSFLSGFKDFFGNPKEMVILGLLPNYLEQGDSSLVYMVQKLIDESNNELSGFFLDDFSGLLKNIEQAKQKNKKIVLFGVSYALLDLADKNVDLSNVIVIETGGMKGRRKEMVKEKLHQELKNKLHLTNIHSEYGMSELLSQAYSMKNGVFKPSKGMKILIRDTTDPFSYLPNGMTGGINVIDLFNCYSCSFIATQDLGKIVQDGFEIMGRFDQSEIRGCNLLVN